MSDKIIENNQVTVIGEVVSGIWRRILYHGASCKAVK